MLDQGAESGFQLFSCKFWHKMALVFCPCAFQLRRLAQSVCRGLGIHLGRGIFLINSRIRWPLRRVHVRFAGSREVWVAVSGSIWGAAFFPVIFSQNKMAPPVTCPCAFRLRRLAQSVGRGLGIHLGRGIFPVNSCIRL